MTSYQVLNILCERDIRICDITGITSDFSWLFGQVVLDIFCPSHISMMVWLTVILSVKVINHIHVYRLSEAASLIQAHAIYRSVEITYAHKSRSNYHLFFSFDNIAYSIFRTLQRNGHQQRLCVLISGQRRQVAFI